MKVNEQILYDQTSDKLVVKKTHLNDPYIEKARQMREAGVGQTGEHRLAGIIPMHLLNEWFKEAGITWDDTQACQEVVKRKMLSGEFDKLRVWEGRY